MIISPKTKIGELLDTYPSLESVLMEMSPVFAKLKNPVLRKTVARVATIQQISIVGGIPVDEIINRLRKAAGQTATEEREPDHEKTLTGPPAWFNPEKITARYDAIPVINSGGSPMNEILYKANQLQPGEIMELKTPFIPAPILDILKNKKFIVYTIQNENFVNNYITPYR